MLSTVLRAWNKTNRWHRAVAVLALVQFGVIPQRTTGFYCNDSTIAHPYTGDTISWKLLLGLAILFPLFVIVTVELIARRDENFHGDGDKVSVKRSRPQSLRWCREYGFGLVANVVLVQLIKVLVAEPRPHFLDVCRPDAVCEGTEFVSDYKCTKTIYSDSRIADSARSFPSGHTSISLHACLFTAWYLHKRVGRSSWYLSTQVLAAQVSLLAAAVLCGVSRVTDRRHHWWDVVAGAVLGAATLVYTVKYLCNDFACSEPATPTAPADNGSGGGDVPRRHY